MTYQAAPVWCSDEPPESLIYTACSPASLGLHLLIWDFKALAFCLASSQLCVIYCLQKMATQLVPAGAKNR